MMERDEMLMEFCENVMFLNGIIVVGLDVLVKYGGGEVMM